MTPAFAGNGEKGRQAIQRFRRYAGIYGLRRTMIKALGRLRRADSRLVGIGLLAPKRRDIAVIGCGQFGFSTIGYLLGARFGRCFAACYDPDANAAASFARFWGCERLASVDDVLADPAVTTVYVASNHASHADQAARALGAGKTVYVEKPIAVDRDQLERLQTAAAAAGPGRLFAGYNRPFSAATRRLREVCGQADATDRPLTLACVVQGHDIPADHWYRKPSEGTRIAGNVGHWLDLAVHMLCWRGTAPAAMTISCHWADDKATDDNLSITISTPQGDLVSIVLTARSEPYEGIRETIVAQWGSVHCEIEDFRRMTIRREASLEDRRFVPKDVGHRRAILQPFAAPAERRDFDEIWLSTRLMLTIADMVRSGRRDAVFDPPASVDMR